MLLKELEFIIGESCGSNKQRLQPTKTAAKV